MRKDVWLLVRGRKEDLEQVNPQLYKWLRTFNSKSSADSVHDSSAKSNEQNVNLDDDMQHSEKMQDDLFDESDRRKADKAEILEDLKRFVEYIKLEKKYAHSKHIDPKTLNMVTKWLCEKAATNYQKIDFAKQIG